MAEKWGSFAGSIEENTADRASDHIPKGALVAPLDAYLEPLLAGRRPNQREMEPRRPHDPTCWFFLD
jgi:hypothetical protein